MSAAAPHVERVVSEIYLDDAAVEQGCEKETGVCESRKLCAHGSTCAEFFAPANAGAGAEGWSDMLRVDVERIGGRSRAD